MNLGPRHLVRAADADLLDTFLVAAVATVVVIRIFLEATGYPQRSRSGLTYQVGLNEAVFRFLGLSSDSGVVAGHPAESAGVGVGRAVWTAICEAAGDPPSGPQAARGQAGEDE